MKISNRDELHGWLVENFWFDDGFVSSIQGDLNNLRIRLGYQTQGTYRAGEPEELIEFEIHPKGVKRWTWDEHHQFQPSYDWCIEGIKILDEGLGLIFETPYRFELVFESLEISNQKTIKTFTKPWTNESELRVVVKGMQTPKPSYWIKMLEESGLKVGFRYYCGDMLPLEKVPYPDYIGFYLQHQDIISDTNEGVFFQTSNREWKHYI